MPVGFAGCRCSGRGPGSGRCRSPPPRNAATRCISNRPGSAAWPAKKRACTSAKSPSSAIERLVPQRRARQQRLQPGLDAVGQAPGGGMQPAVGADRRAAATGRAEIRGSPARSRSSRSRYQVPASVPIVPRQSLRKAAQPGRSSRASLAMSIAQPGRRAEFGEQVVDAVALVVAEEHRIAEAAPAEVDRARLRRACRGGTPPRWRHAATPAPRPRIAIEPLPGLQRQLRADPIGADLAQEAALVAERRPRQVVFVADEHQEPAAPGLQRLAQRQ